MSIHPAIRRGLSWFRWSGRLEVSVLAAIFIAVSGIWIFGSLAAEVMEGDTVKFDERILLALRQPGNIAVPVGPPWALQAARDVTGFGGPVGLGLVTVIVTGYLLLQRHYGLSGLILASVLGGMVLTLSLKALFHRPRPAIVPHLTDIATSSFPSGHSMLSSITYLTLAALLARTAPDLKTKAYLLIVTVLLISLIGASRVYLGVHYPTDVLAGWAVGCSWAILCCLTAHYLAKKRIVPEAGGLMDGPDPRGE